MTSLYEIVNNYDNKFHNCPKFFETSGTGLKEAIKNFEIIYNKLLNTVYKDSTGKKIIITNEDLNGNLYIRKMSAGQMDDFDDEIYNVDNLIEDVEELTEEISQQLDNQSMVKDVQTITFDYINI